MNLNESIVVPILISATELLKGVGLPKKFAALATVIMGIFVGMFYLEPMDYRTGIFKGIIYGLTASGLYSGTKNTVEQFSMNRKKHH